MIIETVAAKPEQFNCDTIILGILEDSLLSKQSTADEVDESLGGAVRSLLKDQPSCMKYGEVTPIYTSSAIAAKSVLLIGLGKADQLTNDRLRSLGAIGARAARKMSAKTAGFLIDQKQMLEKVGIQAFVEGIYLGLYEFNHYKTSKKSIQVDNVYLVFDHHSDAVESRPIVRKAIVIAESVCFARDLVNHPSNFITPSRLADLAGEIARQSGFELTILRADGIQNQGLEALWAVGKGSDEPPVLIVITYHGNPQSTEIIGLVGKGITFDSGGISLKPSDGMGEMKDDMGGAAAVLAAMKGIGQLKPKNNIIAVIPCAENMPSGRALKPGDVIQSLSGKTIEIISTDAEGRLILADAISYACKLGATKLIDLATLTGACVVALGKVSSAIITNNDVWSKQILAAAELSGEKMWQLPAYDEYKDQIKSDIADLKNSGGRPAGAITAGLFLAEFTEGNPWVHIDIAGTVTSEKEHGYNAKGATGVGVRTLIQLADSE